MPRWTRSTAVRPQGGGYLGNQVKLFNQLTYILLVPQCVRKGGVSRGKKTTSGYISLNP